MSEPLETAQFHGDDAHAIVARPEWASEHGLGSVVVVVRDCDAQLGVKRSPWKLLAPSLDGSA